VRLWNFVEVDLVVPNLLKKMAVLVLEPQTVSTGFREKERPSRHFLNPRPLIPGP
jgi:hypothetical protein